jgi:hypothetical protein
MAVMSLVYISTDNEVTMDPYLASLKPLSLWRHKKGGLYIVLGISTNSTNGHEGEQVVVYYSTKYEALRHRVIGEFLDGWFLLETINGRIP